MCSISQGPSPTWALRDAGLRVTFSAHSQDLEASSAHRPEPWIQAQPLVPGSTQSGLDRAGGGAGSQQSKSHHWANWESVLIYLLQLLLYQAKFPALWMKPELGLSPTLAPMPVAESEAVPGSVPGAAPVTAPGVAWVAALAAGASAVLPSGPVGMSASVPASVAVAARAWGAVAVPAPVSVALPPSAAAAAPAAVLSALERSAFVPASAALAAPGHLQGVSAAESVAAPGLRSAGPGAEIVAALGLPGAQAAARVSVSAWVPSSGSAAALGAPSLRAPLSWEGSEDHIHVCQLAPWAPNKGPDLGSSPGSAMYKLGSGQAATALWAPASPKQTDPLLPPPTTY